MRKSLLSVFAVIGVLSAQAVQAEPVATQAQLNTLLGASAETENFSEFGQNDYSTPTINSSNGLTAGDLSFTSADSSFQTDAPGYYGAQSNELLTNTGLLTLNFLNNVTAFGLNVRDFVGYSMTAAITVYGLDDTTVRETLNPYAISSSGATSFIGYQNADGIGAVSFQELSGSGSWSPLVSNITYGTAQVPEPATLSLFAVAGLSLAWARRRTSFNG